MQRLKRKRNLLDVLLCEQGYSVRIIHSLLPEASICETERRKQFNFEFNLSIILIRSPKGWDTAH